MLAGVLADADGDDAWGETGLPLRSVSERIALHDADPDVAAEHTCTWRWVTPEEEGDAAAVPAAAIETRRRDPATAAERRKMYLHGGIGARIVRDAACHLPVPNGNDTLTITNLHNWVVDGRSAGGR